MKKNKNLIFVIISIVIMIGVGIWYYYYNQGKNYFTTDNAKVTAQIYTITPVNSGRLSKLDISEGDFVKENEVIGKLDNGSLLRSPIAGQVVKCNVVVNQTVSPAVVVAVIADTDNIYVGVNIEETAIRKIKEGQEAIVQLDAYPGEEFKAHVEQLSKVTQTAISGNATSFSTSGTYTKVIQLIPVKVVIDDDVNLDGLIGTNSTVRFKLR